MKMAKASDREWEQVMEFTKKIEEHRSMSEQDLLALVRQAPPLMRVVYGYRVLVDNCCDPDKDYLDWKPALLAAMNAQTKEPLP